MATLNRTVIFQNPYRPGAGHMPPHLAGREKEHKEFARLLAQQTILENMVLTGLRGVGKTVLLDAFKPIAMHQGWLWVGTDLSESATVSEETISVRLIADLSVATSAVTTNLPVSKAPIGFLDTAPETPTPLTFGLLKAIYDSTPGLVADKLKAVLEFTYGCLAAENKGRVIFAYDEAQNLADHVSTNQFPLSLLLDVFQSIQKKNIPFMLVLTGLPTLFPKLIGARTFAERMFRVVTVGRLNHAESRDAIRKPLAVAGCPVKFTEESVEVICQESGGYPYFIQFMCREVFDVFIQQADIARPVAVPIDAIQRKLDTDFFAGRWAKVTDRQRQLLWVTSLLEHCDEEFTIQEIMAMSRKQLEKSFSSSHANQILNSLGEQGLIYKNRFGRYSFAVPLLGKFVQRTYGQASKISMAF